LFVWESERGELQRIASSRADESVNGAPAGSTELLKYVAGSRRSAIESEDSTIHVIDGSLRDAEPPVGRLGRAFAIPLVTSEQTVGALRISGQTPFDLSADQWRV